MRQHDQLALGKSAVRRLNRELSERERFRELRDTRPQPLQLPVVKWLQARIEAPQVAGSEEMNDEGESRAFSLIVLFLRDCIRRDLTPFRTIGLKLRGAGSHHEVCKKLTRITALQDIQ